MKYIRKFNESVSNFLSKEDLDNMSKEEIEDYRYDIIKSVDPKIEYRNSEEKRYVEELELYLHIRFKEDKLKTYNRWKSEVDDDAKKLLSGIDNESLWKLSIFSFEKDYGKPKYIKMDIPKITLE